MRTEEASEEASQNDEEMVMDVDCALKRAL